VWEVPVNCTYQEYCILGVLEANTEHGGGGRGILASIHATYRTACQIFNISYNASLEMLHRSHPRSDQNAVGNETNFTTTQPDYLQAVPSIPVRHRWNLTWGMTLQYKVVYLQLQLDNVKNLKVEVERSRVFWGQRVVLTIVSKQQVIAWWVTKQL